MRYFNIAEILLIRLLEEEGTIQVSEEFIENFNHKDYEIESFHDKLEGVYRYSLKKKPSRV